MYLNIGFFILIKNGLTFFSIYITVISQYPINIVDEEDVNKYSEVKILLIIMFHHQVNSLYILKRYVWIFIFFTYSYSTMSWRYYFLLPVIGSNNLDNWLLHWVIMCYGCWGRSLITFTKLLLTIFKIWMYPTGCHRLTVHSISSNNFTALIISSSMNNTGTHLV